MLGRPGAWGRRHDDPNQRLARASRRDQSPPPAAATAPVTPATTVSTRPPPAAVTSAPAGADVAAVVFSSGASGVRVRELQARLVQVGALSGAVDGRYGPGTAAAVARF